MPSPTMERGMLGHFLRGADPARGRSAQGGVSGRSSQKESRGGGSGAGGRKGNREWKTSGDPRSETRTMAAKTETTATTEPTAQASGRQGQGHQVRSVGSGKEYRAGGGAEGESVDKRSGWSGTDLYGSANDEEGMTTEGRDGTAKCGWR